jgi:hypothetical protein
MNPKRFLKSIILYSLIAVTISCKKNIDLVKKSSEPLFKLVPPNISKINFNNKIRENDQFNIVNYYYVYNGGGVAIGDLNNDSLPDIYFTGNMVHDAIYINKGGLTFEENNSFLGASTEGWSSGVTMVDINHDGLLDIYVCRSGNYDKPKRKNLLYINQGDLNFVEQAEMYGLADNGYSTQAAFFDYDKDGDLDMYLLNHTNELRDPNSIRPLISDGSGPANDRLYRNDENLGNGIKFTDVTSQAGIYFDGFGLGLGIADVNNDGWEDVFVTNDFLSNDYIYINQQDGTFKEMANQYFDHVSHFSMGNDIGDFNNDGLVDLVTVDMRPTDNYHQKKMAGPLNFDLFEMSLKEGYLPQYMRNTLQRNVGGNFDSITRFSEIAQLMGIDATDWSWGPLLADFDNDGFKDLFITNGYLRDITNLDFVNYTNTLSGNIALDSLDNILKQMAKKMPSIKKPNVMFKNEEGLTFNNVTDPWGIWRPTLSNGAAYADLDNDGDLDLVINNINEVASIYENRSNSINQRHYVDIHLVGDSLNPSGLGTEIRLYQLGRLQLNRQHVTRGYLSAVNKKIHFGLGANTKVDSLLITWPNGVTKKIRNPKIDQTLTISMEEGTYTRLSKKRYKRKIFNDVTDSLKLGNKHGETIYFDFDREYLLPFKLSNQGPGMAVGDINNDGQDDLFMGGGYNHSGQFLFSHGKGAFISKKLISNEKEKYQEDTGVLLFDFDNDNDLDLYIASGSNEFYEHSEYYMDRLYSNDGSGNFTLTEETLPPTNTSNSCVRAADFDMDGDLDLFVGGRLTPLKYPFPCTSYLLQNNGGKFIDVTEKAAPALKNLGMVKDALWTDFDMDGDLDLLAVGEFMPIEFFENKNGVLVNKSSSTGLRYTSGLWNSINGGDFDNDGDIDYILGNAGLNSRYTVSKTEPLSIYALDYDRNGALDPIMTTYNNGIEYPVHSRDDLLKQIPSLKKKFPDYESYAKAAISDILTKQDMSSAYIARAFNLASSLLLNKGDGKFELIPLPLEAQFAPVYGIGVRDYDNDGNLDVLLSGNDYGPEVSVGRNDASKGLFLKGTGDNSFKPAVPMESGLLLGGNLRGISEMSVNNDLVVVFATNNGKLTSYKKVNLWGNFLKIPSEAVFADVILGNGKKRMHEFYYGSGYLSQSTRDMFLSDKIQKVTLYDKKKNVLMTYQLE